MMIIILFIVLTLLAPNNGIITERSVTTVIKVESSLDAEEENPDEITENEIFSEKE